MEGRSRARCAGVSACGTGFQPVESAERLPGAVEVEVGVAPVFNRCVSTGVFAERLPGAVGVEVGGGGAGEGGLEGGVVVQIQVYVVVEVENAAADV